jgi:hypothetical protein
MLNVPAVYYTLRAPSLKWLIYLLTIFTMFGEKVQQTF